MLNAIKAIYKDVSCCVRINGMKTDFLHVSSGLKQGCLLSPLLFNLFLNDLSQEIKNCGRGVDIEGEIISLLLYADDLCFICDSEDGLQEMLNILHSWCEHWSMVVNVKKTKILHFRPKCIPCTAYNFKLGEHTIMLTDRYKYLGLILTEFLDYNITAKMVARSAGHALGLLIAKMKAY